MKLLRFGLPALMLLAGGAGWLYLHRLEESYRDQGANYSLIEERLYVGGDVKAPPPGTGAVLNLCRKKDPYRCAIHVWEPIRDTAPGPTLDWLRERVEWIDTQRRAGVTVYVHCRNGVSRSGLLVTAYIMHEKNLSRDEALAFVRRKRPGLHPHSAFRMRLLEWECVLKARAVFGSSQ
jgi:hypothetical protein